MRQGKVFSLEEAIKITREILLDLKIIHAAGLIHRDIKPDNIIFVGNKAKLSDPGLIARQDSPLSIVGTPGFIPPEILIKNCPIDYTCDLYALGKVFYCLISGNKPEEYPHLPKDMPLEIRRQVFPILARMCNSNASKRFRSADEFLAKLPAKLRPANFYEKSLKSFWNWKTLNREIYRFILGSIIFIIIAIIFSITGFFWYNLVQQEKLLLLEEKTKSFKKINSQRWNLLDWQIKHSLPSIYKDFQLLSTQLDKATKLLSFSVTTPPF
jgi:serine/threonine protein kinase